VIGPTGLPSMVRYLNTNGKRPQLIEKLAFALLRIFRSR
jgi:hypothetical protein